MKPKDFNDFLESSHKEFKKRVKEMYPDLLVINNKPALLYTTTPLKFNFPEGYKLSRNEAQSILGGPCVDSFNRLQTFIEITPWLQNEVYWQSLNFAYTTSDNVEGTSPVIKGLFTCKSHSAKEQIMDEEDRKILQDLPEYLTIYRGMTVNDMNNKVYGLSWSLDIKVAEYFAYTYNRNLSNKHLAKTVVAQVINKEKVVPFFNDRKEQEIIAIF